MSRLLIVGAGGFGREVLDAVEATPAFRKRHHIETICFLDDAGSPDISLEAPVIGSVASFVSSPGDVALCAIGAPGVRREVTRQLEARGLAFPPFVHATAQVGRGTRLNDGVVICGNSVITSNVLIGRHTHINVACTIGHDVVIDEYVTLSSNCSLPGMVRVGAGSFFGTAAVTLPNITVGEESRVGAGSVVIRNVPARKTVFGNPAKVIW